MSDGEVSWIEALNEDWSGPLRLRVCGRSMWPTLRPGDQVTVERAEVDALRAGDWVLLQRQGSAVFLHRFLGFTRQGLLLTKGDGHRAPDSPWPPEAVLGRAVAFCRQGQTVPISSSSVRERARTAAHRLMAAAWLLLHRVGMLLALMGMTPAIALAAVTLVPDSFKATPQGQVIRVAWETASEVNMSQFYVRRALQDGGECTVNPSEYQRVSNYIWAVGDIVGASYVYTDTDVTVGQTYYYCLEAVEADSTSDFYGPISATLSLVTATPTPTITPTPTATRTSVSVPAQTPIPTATRTPAPTATQTPVPTATWTPVPAVSPVPSPTSTPSPLHTAAPSATPAPVPPTIIPSATPVPPSPLPALTATPPSPTPTSIAVSVADAGSPTPSPASPPPASEPAPTPSPVAAPSPTPTFASSPLPTETATPAPAESFIRRPARQSLSPCLLPLALAAAGVGLILLSISALGWITRRKE